MTSKKRVIGWREWVALPTLGIERIKAKVDTGARTSALHAFSLEPYWTGETAMIRFCIHPLQRRSDVAVECHAQVADRRWVSDSGGHREYRYVIATTVELAGRRWPIEVTLTDRDPMLFRMLLGRTALKGDYVVDPQVSYRLSGRTRSE